LSKKARATLRARLLAILRKPGARERIRRGQALGIILAAFTLFTAFYSLVYLKEWYLATTLKEEIPLGPLFSDAGSQHLFFAMKSASAVREQGPDWPRVFELLEEADATHPTPYAAFLRAAFLFQRGVADRLRNIRKAVAAGGLLEPDNVLWPLIEAQARALQGRSREALRDLLAEIPTRPAFRWPLPEGPDRDLLLTVELLCLHDLLPGIVERLGPLSAEAVLEAQEGDVRGAQELAALFERAARVSIEGRRKDECIGRLELLFAAGRLLTERAAILAAAPRAFGPAEGPLAAQRAALAASAVWGVRDWVLRTGIALVPCLVLFFNAMELILLPLDLIRWLLGRGKAAAGWILLAVPLRRSVLPSALLGACLGVLWVLALKWGLLSAVAVAAPLLVLALALSDSFLMNAWAEPGAWRLRIGKGRLYLGPSGKGAFLAGAILAIVAGFLYFPPQAVRDQWRLLLSPSRTIAASMCLPDDRTASRSETLLAAALDPDPARVEAACRREGIELPPRLPESVVAALREQVEVLREERAQNEKR